jgi:hypothetical protein
MQKKCRQQGKADVRHLRGPVDKQTYYGLADLEIDTRRKAAESGAVKIVHVSKSSMIRAWPEP